MALSDQLNSQGADLPVTTTIRQLVQAVGSPVLHVLAAPGGIDQRVRGTVLHDRIDALPDEPDSVLLMSGIRADDPDAIELLGEAADHGYCAVVVKRRGAEIPDLVAEASRLNVIVLAAADEVSWRHLDGLMLSVLRSRGGGSAEVSGAGDELFALANAIGAVIGGSVSIEDLDRRVIAYSSRTDQRIDGVREQGILDRRVPDSGDHLGEYRSVLRASGVVRFPDKQDEFARAAIAIKAGERPLGTIWAIEGISGIGADGERTLVEGARLAALKILRSQNATGLELQLREAAMIRALDGSLAASETQFRLSLPEGVEVSLVGFAAMTDEGAALPLITHVASTMTRYIAAYRPDASVATVARAVYVLLPGGGREGAARFASGALSATQEMLPDQVRAALSFSSTDPAELPAMRREVDDILQVTTALADGQDVASLDDVHARVLLSRLADVLVHEPRLRHTGVEAMIRSDNDQGTNYVESVMAWLEAVGDMAGAARRLGVHPNTLRYRLRRAAELFDVSFDAPDGRLSMWMQLRLAVR